MTEIARSHILIIAFCSFAICSFTYLELKSKSQLSKYPALNNLEKQTSVPKVYAFLGAVGLYFFFIFFNFGGQILTNLAGFVIPSYYSLEALFSTTKVDDTQWLTVSFARNA